jgi:hypothetical protein
VGVYAEKTEAISCKYIMKCGMNTSFDVVIYRNRNLQEKDNLFSILVYFSKNVYLQFGLGVNCLGQDLLQIKQVVYFFIRNAWPKSHTML